MTLDEFWKTVEKTETCWNWTGGLNGGGYGSALIVGLGKDGAHRHSYRLANGDFDPALYVLHRCDNARCVNPAHLFLGTQSDNMQDCAAKGRNPNAYRFPSGPDHPYFGKTTSDANKKAMSERKQKPFSVVAPDGTVIHGVNLTKFCREHGLNNGAMFSVINGRIPWPHKGYRRFIPE